MMLLERDAALDILSRTLQCAAGGRGQIVVVEGEPGIGKTSLLQHFFGAIDGEHAVHWGWCDPFSTPRALGPLQDMAKTLNCGIDTMLARGASPDSLFPGVLDALMRGEKTNVLIFEDLHWVDSSTLDLLRFLGRRVALLRTMIVLTLRGHDVGSDHPVTQLLGDLPAALIARISLPPLSPGAVTTLAGTAARGEALFRATGGNPFFVTELLAVDSGSDGRVPVSIRDAVWARRSRLPSGLRDFLDMMSILPGGAEPFVVHSLLADDAGQTADQCVTRGLLRYDERGALIFRHELARQATLERLLPATRRSLHVRIEKALAGHPEADTNPAILSQRLYHVVQSDDGLRILELAPKVAARAASLGAHQQAASHLATALARVALASPDEAAQLYEDWALEAFLANSVATDEIVRAHAFAIALFRSLGQIEKVGLNLCRLARVHWRRGETDTAVSYTERAITELEARPPSSELALAYSTRSQLLMLKDQFEASITWGERAIELSDLLGQVETRIHALNNVGTSLMLSDQPHGAERLEQSLTLALAYGHQDHASRAYTNLSECCMVFRDFASAERLLGDGIAFCVDHDLDPAAHYLLGHQAHLRMEQGRFREAEAIANGVMAKPGLPLVMHLPALTVLGRVGVRLGAKDATSLLHRALTEGLATKEPQRILPVRFGLVEAAWLSEEIGEAHRQLEELAAMDVANFRSWDLGEMLVWRQRCSITTPIDTPDIELPAPRAAELDERHVQAADMWLALDQPYEAALALMHAKEGAASARAVEILDGLEARPAAALTRRVARANGVANTLPRRRRGPYSAAKRHPLGLTLSEQGVLALISEGLSNKEIARRESRSLRTVEHQVSSVLGKLNATKRMDALLRVRNEPWLLGAGEA